MSTSQKFDIPEPKLPDKESIGGALSLTAAAKEEYLLTHRTWEQFHEHYDWVVRIILRPLLFAFVIFLNIWWDFDVSALLWQSGRKGNGFHLDNAVLIALVTTSMANFLALVAIMARHLFPTPRAAEKLATHK